MATAALVMGIISLVISVGGGAANLAWVGSVCGVLGIIFGSLGMKDASKKGQAKAGLILSIIALTWGIVATVLCITCIGAGAALSGGFLDKLESYF